MLKVKLLSSAPMSTPIVCGAYQARRNDSEGFLSIRGTAAEGLREDPARPATTEGGGRSTVGDRLSAPEWWRWWRWTIRKPGGVACRPGTPVLVSLYASAWLRECQSALTCSSGKKYMWKVHHSMNRGPE